MSTSVRGFSVAHQKVAVEVEVTKQVLRGWTEITVVPTLLDLKQIVLDARRLTIEKCFVNGIESNFEHHDLLTHPPEAPLGWGAQQHPLYGEKLSPLMSKDGDGPGELVISIPKSVKITEPNEATFIASHSTKEKTYEPLTLRVFYHINEDGPNEGLRFVNTDTKEAHVYTTHTPIAQATSCWLPCVDGLWSLSTWELEFSIPQVLDINDPESELVVACNDTAVNEEPHPTNAQRKIVKFGVFSPVSSQHVGFAVGPFVQIPLGFVEEKQIKPADAGAAAAGAGTTNINTTAGAATANGGGDANDTESQQHVNAADAGAVDTETNGDEEKTNEHQQHHHHHQQHRAEDPAAAAAAATATTEQSSKQKASKPAVSKVSRRANESQSLPIVVYALPSKAALVPHSCSSLPRAMDYFTRDFGSFPYNSYSVVFVADSTPQTADACALTVCSDTLLFPADVIEAHFSSCDVLVRSIAAQWCGVNIVPSTWNDMWVTEGISLYLTGLFVRKLMGNNEYRFRIRRGNEELCKEDVDRPPIGKPRFRFPLVQEDLAFIRLKAPLVLFILDRRMTKTDRSLGVSRVLTKLFLQSMSGDLRSQLSTAHFVRQCEKVAHHRLAAFFDEWVFGSGYPIFRITQRFNKKRLCIEMGIGQVHSRELPRETLRDSTFLERAVTHLKIAEHEEILSAEEVENLRLMRELAGTAHEGADPAMKPDFVPLASFTGPMTIRIHEANGTPYEHVVELKDKLTKIDIPYNTKYKRLRRNQKFKKATGKDVNGNANGNGNASEPSDGLINCLGDVLMTDAEIQDWIFVDWGDGGEEEEGMFNEAFEWLRADADFEWLGQFFVSQPDYMYASQLQQDRDIVAQYDAVAFYGRQQANTIYCTVLTRTIMDKRYYYGVRILAAHTLAKLAVPQLNYAGMHLLLRIFRELYCIPRSRLPRANDFQDFAAYFLQKAIPQALSKIRDHSTGRCPSEVCKFILDLIRYNENSENAYSDSLYIANLLECATNTLRPIDLETGELAVRGGSVVDNDDAMRDYITDVVNEIDKCQRLDRWVPSHLRVITQTAIKQEELLILAGIGEPRMDKLLLASQPEEPVEVRLAAVSSILNLAGYRNAQVVEYLFGTMIADPSVRMHAGIIEAVKTLLGHVALYGEYLQGADLRKLRQISLARRSVQTAIPLLRETLANADALKTAIWKALTNARTGTYGRRLLLEMCRVLYKPEAKWLARMKSPKLYELSLKRASGRNWVMVAKYRNVLRKRKRLAESTPQQSAAPESGGSGPKLKLRLR